jgi:hypothetical protein
MFEDKKRDWLSDTVVLFALPIVAYLLAYLWELGYCDVFGIPVEFVSVNPVSLVEDMAAMLVNGVLSHYVVGLIFVLGVMLALAIDFFLARKFTASREKIRQSSRRFLPFLPSLFMAGVVVCTWVALHIPARSLAVLVFFLSALFVAIRVSGFVREIVKELIGSSQTAEGVGFGSPELLGPDRKRVKSDESQRSQAFIGPSGVKVVEFVLYFVLLIVLAWGGGSRFAQTQTYFLLPVSAPNTVVLKIYGDKIITAPFDPATRTVEPKFKILKPENDQLEWKKLGRLRLNRR